LRHLRKKWAYLSGGLILVSKIAFAWDQHHYLMPLVLNGASPELKQVLSQSGLVPCESEDQATFKKLVDELDLNSSAKLPPISTRKCSSTSRMSVYDVLTSGVVDDPDHGIDKDLPVDAKYDPNQDRKWMGGTSPGPTSQGYRHMYFAGWKWWSHPLSTFQIPTRPLGQAPKRFEVTARKAKELIKAGNIVWGARTLGWSMHYLQDLTQPFHAVQAVTLKMVPWSELLTWPPSEGFERLVKETTRTITNYHWAYEGYVRDQVKRGQESPLYDCFAQPEKYSKIQFDPKVENPIELAYSIARASVELAPRVGSAQLEFFGTFLLNPGVDFTKNLSLINNEEIAVRPDLSEARNKLHEVTCQALANTTLGSRYLIQWAFQP
jgi:hypothetical protein